MLHERRLAMQQLRRTIHDSAVDGSDGLVPEAHPQDRDLARAFADHLHAHTGILGCARTR